MRHPLQLLPDGTVPSYEITPPSFPRCQRQRKYSSVETKFRAAAASLILCPTRRLALTSHGQVPCAIPASGAGKCASCHSQGTTLQAEAHHARDISLHKAHH